MRRLGPIPALLILLSIVLAGCEQRTVTDPGASTAAEALGLVRKNPTSRGQDYATRELVPGVGIGDIRVGTSTLADVERVLGSDFSVSGPSEECNDSACDVKNRGLQLEYIRVGLNFAFLLPPNVPVEQAVVRVISANCRRGGDNKCAWRGATSKGLKLDDDRDRAIALHGEIEPQRHTGNLVYPDGLVVSTTYQSSQIGQLTVFRPEDIGLFR